MYLAFLKNVNICFLQVQPLPKGDHILNFSDAEELIDDKQLKEPVNPSIAKEAAMNDRKQKKEIRNLEQELPKWQVLVESVTGERKILTCVNSVSLCPKLILIWHGKVTLNINFSILNCQ